MAKETDRRFTMDVENMATPKHNATAKQAAKTLQRNIGSGKGPGRPKKK